MPTPTWYFREMADDEITLEAIQSEFFNQSDLAERLVREALQNSLDARDGQQTVHVRFAFSGHRHALSVDDAQRYLRDLHPHLHCLDPVNVDDGAVQGTYVPSAVAEQPMQFLTIEDSGTTGLVGDTDGNPGDVEGNNFWGFFRSIGISPKGEDDAGSWGLGKWVFPDASLIRSFIALTRRGNESRDLLMGMSIVKTHQAPSGARYPYYGHFVADPAAAIQTPLDSSNDPDGFVDAFQHHFLLERRSRAGLSVVILHPNPVLTPSSIARAVITQYFYPIVRGRLEVEITAPASEARVITADTIDDELSRIARSDDVDSIDRAEESPESLKGLVGLTKWGESLDIDRHYIEADLPTSKNSDTFLSDHELPDLRKRFMAHERLAFFLRLNVRRRGEQPTPTHCRVFIERDDSLAAGHDYFVRGDLHVPYMDHLTHASVKARALMLVPQNNELGHMLRDAEGPAHTSWEKHESRLKANWIAGGARVSEVRQVPLRLIQALSVSKPQRERALLADLFPASEPERRSPEPTPRPRRPLDEVRIKISRPPVIRELPDSPFEISSRKGEFRVRPAGGTLPNPIGSEWIVQFAYDIARWGPGKAFSYFDQCVKEGYWDFSVIEGVLEVNANGCSVEPIAHNKLRMRIDSDDFSLAVDGFDSRDIVVRVDALQSEVNV